PHFLHPARPADSAALLWRPRPDVRRAAPRSPAHEPRLHATVARPDLVLDLHQQLAAGPPDPAALQLHEPLLVAGGGRAVLPDVAVDRVAYVAPHGAAYRGRRDRRSTRVPDR